MTATRTRTAPRPTIERRRPHAVAQRPTAAPRPQPRARVAGDAMTLRATRHGSLVIVWPTG